MGCSSCGQRYKSPRARPATYTQRGAPRPPANIRNANQRVDAVVKSDPKEQAQGMIQPDVPAGIVIPAPDYPVEPATGIPLSVVMTGECPENSLGETTLKPVGTADGYGNEGAAQDSYFESPKDND